MGTLTPLRGFKRAWVRMIVLRLMEEVMVWPEERMGVREQVHTGMSCPELTVESRAPYSIPHNSGCLGKASSLRNLSSGMYVYYSANSLLYSRN